MIDFSAYSTYIDEHLKKINVPEGPSNLYDPFRYFLSIGGKRIRPMLTLMSAEMFGLDKESSISQAMCIEVFHNFTLIHDDIMDKAPLRRNKETVHEKWNENIAILSGDVMLIKAYELLSEIESAKLPELLKQFNQTAREVCEGQQLDMDFQERNDVSIHEYIEMIRLKTSVLLGCALVFGAIVAGANEKDKKALFSFGQNIGIAFQIQDDILDLYGNAETFGKQTGGDVISNKKTILLLTALSKASKEQLEISRQLEKEEDSELKIKRTRELFDHLKVKEDCLTRIKEHYKIAMDALNRISTSSDKKKPLIALAEYLMHRDV